VTCLRHAEIVETQKSLNTLRNNRESGVYSVPFRAAGGWRPGRAEPHCTRAFPRQRPVNRLSRANAHNTGRNACGSLPCNRQRNNATTVARMSLTELNYIAIVFGVSVQRSYPEGHMRYRASFKEEFEEWVFSKKQSREVRMWRRVEDCFKCLSDSETESAKTTADKLKRLMCKLCK
jgi:hypothetical protein